MASVWKVVAAAARGLAFGLGAVALGGGLIALGGLVDPRLDLAAHLAPVWMACALIAVVCAALPPRGWPARILAGLGAMGAVASGFLIAPELTRPIRPPAPD